VLLAIGIIFIMDGVSQRILNRHFMEPWVAFIIVFLISLSGFVSKKGSNMTRKIASDVVPTPQEKLGEAPIAHPPVAVSPVEPSPSTATVISATKFCRQCGAKIPCDSKFCEECGAKIEA